MLALSDCVSRLIAMQETEPQLRLRSDSIRGAMKARNIPNISSLAELLLTSRTTMYDVMAGRAQPSPELIAAIRLRLQLPWDFIVDAVEVPVEREARRSA